MIDAPRCFFANPGPGSEACLPHYLPQGGGFLLGLESLMNPISVCVSEELAAIQMLIAAARLFCTHIGSLLAITTPEGLFIHLC